MATRTVQEMRAFNRFYTNLIGALDYSRHLHTPYTLTEARVLYELVHSPRTDAADLRAALSVDAGQLSRMLARFEERGLVGRRPSKRDARRVSVELTAAGRDAARLLEERSQGAVESLLEGLAEVERERLAQSLRTTREILAGGAGAGEAASPTEPADVTGNGTANGSGADTGTGTGTRAGNGTGTGTGSGTGNGTGSAGTGAGGTGSACARGEGRGATRPRPRVRLRSPRPGDMGWIIERNASVYAEEFGWDETYEALVARIVAEFAAGHDPAREAAWIAELDGQRAGCVMCVADGAGDTARLRLLLVEPAARGHGLGDRLVAECVGFARAAGYRELVLWTNDVLAAARRIYQRAGFELVGEERHHSFGHELTGQDWRLSL